MKEQQNLLLAHYIHTWGLLADGPPFSSLSSILQPVLWNGEQAVLKIPFDAEEKIGSKLMVLWDAKGAAKVFKYDENALLLERITGELSLYKMVQNGHDDAATTIICDVADRLHISLKKPPIYLHPLKEWFKELFIAEKKHAGIFVKSAAIATQLLGSQHNLSVLHGDLHHQNILFSETRGWLAIDPKGLYGDVGFDYANIFCNPDERTALTPGRLSKQLDIVCKHTGITHKRMLQWVVAYSALSASWHLQDNTNANLALEVNAIALKLLS